MIKIPDSATRDALAGAQCKVSSEEMERCCCVAERLAREAIIDHCAAIEQVLETIRDEIGLEGAIDRVVVARHPWSSEVERTDVKLDGQLFARVETSIVLDQLRTFAWRIKR